MKIFGHNEKNDIMSISKNKAIQKLAIAAKKQYDFQSIVRELPTVEEAFKYEDVSQSDQEALELILLADWISSNVNIMIKNIFEQNLLIRNNIQSGMRDTEMGEAIFEDSRLALDSFDELLQNNLLDITEIANTIPDSGEIQTEDEQIELTAARTFYRGYGEKDDLRSPYGSRETRSKEVVRRLKFISVQANEFYKALTPMLARLKASQLSNQNLQSFLTQLIETADETQEIMEAMANAEEFNIQDVKKMTDEYKKTNTGQTTPYSEEHLFNATMKIAKSVMNNTEEKVVAIKSRRDNLSSLLAEIPKSSRFDEDFKQRHAISSMLKTTDGLLNMIYEFRKELRAYTPDNFQLSAVKINTMTKIADIMLDKKQAYLRGQRLNKITNEISAEFWELRQQLNGHVKNLMWHYNNPHNDNKETKAFQFVKNIIQVITTWDEMYFKKFQKENEGFAEYKRNSQRPDWAMDTIKNMGRTEELFKGKTKRT